MLEHNKLSTLLITSKENLWKITNLIGRRAVFLYLFCKKSKIDIENKSFTEKNLGT